MGLRFWHTAIAAYPFVIGGLVHDPLVRASKAAVFQQGFHWRVRCRVSVPCGDQFIWIAIDCPTAVADDTGKPMPFLIVMDTHPFVVTSSGVGGSRSRWSGLSGGRFCSRGIGRLWLCSGRFRNRRFCRFRSGRRGHAGLRLCGLWLYRFRLRSLRLVRLGLCRCWLHSLRLSRL